MEGALGSVLAGLVDKPVIAVPTSVGYGANLGGISALLTMINSCANGITVVNIDNGTAPPTQPHRSTASPHAPAIRCTYQRGRNPLPLPL